MAFLEGRTLGSCQIIRRIGGGAVGDIYLAEQRDLGRQVAVKVLREFNDNVASDATQQRDTERFIREAQSIAALEHPNILPIYEFGEQDGIYFLVMQYVPSGSLADMVTPGPLQRFSLPLAPELVVKIITDAAAGLQFAHSRQIMHLDIKPHNLLIKVLESPGSYGAITDPARIHVYLADFGLAKFMTWFSQQSGMNGTPLYSAPEQYTGQPVPATDEYALAGVAYQLLTGSPVFSGTVAELHHQHMTVAPRLATDVNPRLPAAVNAVFARALAKSPQYRFPTITAFAQALAESCAQGSGTATTQAPQFASPATVAPPPVVQPPPPVTPAPAAPVYFPPSAPLNAPSGLYSPPNSAGTGSSPLFAPSAPVYPPAGAPPQMEKPPTVTAQSADGSRAKPKALPRILAISGIVMVVALAAVAAGFVLSRRMTTAAPGRIVWQNSAVGSEIDAAPAYYQGVVYITDKAGDIVALEAASGTLHWRYSTKGAITAAPAVGATGTIYVASTDGSLYAFEPTGKLLWTFPTTSALYAEPTEADGVVYVGGNDHNFYAIDARTGKVKWTYKTPNHIFSAAVVADNVVYFGDADANVYALTTSGTLLWSFKTKAIVNAPPLIANGVVYIGSEDHSMYALQATNGNLIWKFTAQGVIAGQPTLQAGLLYFGADDGDIYAVDTTTGNQRWAYKTDGPIHANVLLAQNTVYATSRVGTLYAIQAQNGALAWKKHVASQILCSPLIVNGVLFTGTSDHLALALKL